MLLSILLFSDTQINRVFHFGKLGQDIQLGCFRPSQLVYPLRGAESVWNLFICNILDKIEELTERIAYSLSPQLSASLTNLLVGLVKILVLTYNKSCNVNFTLLKRQTSNSPTYRQSSIWQR